MPDLSTLQPANVTTPAVAALGLAVQVSVALPGEVRAKVTMLVSPVMVLLLASLAVTVGWVPRATPAVLPLGCVVNARCPAAGTTTAALLVLAAVQLWWTAVTT